MTTDRNALIEAVAAVMRENGAFMGGWHADYCDEVACDEVAAEILVAVLPLIADRLAEKAECHRRQVGGYDLFVAYRAAARLVRSLAHDRPETGETEWRRVR